MPRTDRLLGLIALAAAATATLATLALSPGRSEAPRVDLAVFADLVDRLERAEAAVYLVQYEAARTGSDDALAFAVTALRRPGVYAVTDGTSLEVSSAGRTVSCEQLDEGPSCLDSAQADNQLAVAAVVAEMVRSGRYQLERDRATERVAQEHAVCFVLTRERGAEALPQLGDRTELCLADDGVPLRSTTERGGVVDSREATSVRRTVTPADVDRLLEPFDPALAEE